VKFGDLDVDVLAECDEAEACAAGTGIARSEGRSGPVRRRRMGCGFPGLGRDRRSGARQPGAAPAVERSTLRGKPGAGSCVAWACRAPERLCVDVHSAKGANGQSADEERGGVLAMERGARLLRSTDHGLGPEPPSRDGYSAPGRSGGLRPRASTADGLTAWGRSRCARAIGRAGGAQRTSCDERERSDRTAQFA